MNIIDLLWNEKKYQGYIRAERYTEALPYINKIIESKINSNLIFFNAVTNKLKIIIILYNSRDYKVNRNDEYHEFNDLFFLSGLFIDTNFEKIVQKSLNLKEIPSLNKVELYMLWHDIYNLPNLIQNELDLSNGGDKRQYIIQAAIDLLNNLPISENNAHQYKYKYLYLNTQKRLLESMIWVHKDRGCALWLKENVTNEDIIKIYSNCKSHFEMYHHKDTQQEIDFFLLRLELIKIAILIDLVEESVSLLEVACDEFYNILILKSFYLRHKVMNNFIFIILLMNNYLKQSENYLHTNEIHKAKDIALEESDFVLEGDSDFEHRRTLELIIVLHYDVNFICNTKCISSLQSFTKIYLTNLSLKRVTINELLDIHILTKNTQDILSRNLLSVYVFLKKFGNNIFIKNLATLFDYSKSIFQAEEHIEFNNKLPENLLSDGNLILYPIILDHCSVAVLSVIKNEDYVSYDLFCDFTKVPIYPVMPMLDRMDKFFRNLSENNSKMESNLLNTIYSMMFTDHITTNIDFGTYPKLHQYFRLMFSGGKSEHKFDIEKSKIPIKLLHFLFRRDIYSLINEAISVFNDLIFKAIPDTTTKILLSPIGSINTLPLHSLRNNNYYLIEEYDISYSPSFHLLKSKEYDREVNSNRKVFISVTTSDEDTTFIDECKKLSEIVDGYIYENPTKKDFIGFNKSSFDILHVSTHTTVDNPSRFVCDSKMMLIDGGMTISEVPLINTNLTFLSSCKTSFNDTFSLGDSNSFDYSFYSKGSRSIVSSFYDIPLEEAFLFNKAFYKKYMESRNVTTSFSYASRKSIFHGDKTWILYRPTTL